MTPWWSKSSSKEVKKASRESFIDTIHRKFKISSDVRPKGSGGSRRRCCEFASEKGSLSLAGSRSPSPSTLVPRCQSFADRPHDLPLPLPEVHSTSVRRIDSGNRVSAKQGTGRGSRPLSFLPLPKRGHGRSAPVHADAEADLPTHSVSCGSSTDSDDPSDSQVTSPQASDYENGNKTAINSPSSAKHKFEAPVTNQKKSREMLKPANLLSPKWGPSLSRHGPNLQIPQSGAFFSAPDSSMSSPSRSPIRVFGPDPVLNSGFGLLGSGHCSSPGSGHNSGHNSVGGDMSAQLWQQRSRCSPECSPVPSPRMTSPGPSSRIQSGSVTPLHPRAGGSNGDSQQSYRLPLPPLTLSNTCPFSPTSYSTSTTPTVMRSPVRADNPTSPGSRWKKGRMLGRGTFGHVYLGFNRESGEMCAMKEVILFPDDPKSKESAQQLGQEIVLLSRLRHPNIVQYYGTETVDDRLYIYLEYVSGGSIYKLLQDYGQLGEIAIRSYTQQILSGLAYLHAMNTVHRDIKGANILVDPNGRVKLADFGMAKHITGQSCPLSLKGSPYWMAPEVIKNSKGCNHFAVDIWSLGCTVLEMATTKPPWSQYEGVAAMFKIGNSKELPSIPEHLSDDGKDFILQCLQRNPSRRPTAAQLLEHPFVKNIAPSERLISNPDPLEAIPSVTNAVQSLGIGQANKPRNILSCPVSPLGSPLLQPRSPQRMNGRLSPPPILSPRAISGSSTPLTGGYGTIPIHQQIHKQPAAYLHEGLNIVPRSPTHFYPSGTSYQDPKPDMFRTMPQGPPFLREIAPENGFLGNQFGGQSVLADRVSQQLLKNHVKLNPSIDLGPRSRKNEA